MARVGLMDLVIGAAVECHALPGSGHRCFAGGYDLAFGLVPITPHNWKFLIMQEWLGD